jgi:hypothetical protein
MWDAQHRQLSTQLLFRLVALLVAATSLPPADASATSRNAT